MFAASWAFMLSGWRINEKDLPLKILNFGGFQQIKRRNPFGIWITPYYAEDSISDSAHHRKPLLLACTWISNDKKQNRYFPGPDSGRQAAMVWLQRWNQLKKKKNRIRSSKYFPLLDRRRGGDCDFRGGATRRRTQGHKNHRPPKKMLREKKLQVVRILAGGKVEARVVSNRQLFLSITNSSTNCSFLVDTTSHHGEFVSDHLKNCNHSQFWFRNLPFFLSFIKQVDHPVYQTLAFSPKGDFLVYTAEALWETWWWRS